MIREANKNDLDEILQLYLYLHEKSIPEDSEQLRNAWENIINDVNHHLIVCEVDGKIVAVSTGEQLTDDTVVIHCERGDKKYMGVYNYINQEFAKSEWSDYKYINREEDLGIEGLRSSKMTYQPDNLLSKYIAKIEV